MQRNSSFFWASDTLRQFDSEDENADGSGGMVGDGVAVGLEGDDTCNASPQQGDDEEAAAIEFTTCTTKERAPLISINESYGTTDSSSPRVGKQRFVASAVHEVAGDGFERSRRKLFQHHQYGNVLSGSSGNDTKTLSIRFQVVIWYIGCVDVQLGHVPMRFRITLFWNDTKGPTTNDRDKIASNTPESVWVMQGRQRAYCRKDVSAEDHVRDFVDVPPVSILNAVSFEPVGAAEVAMIDEETRSMRWTCMYSATLFQGDHMRVDQFPHDSHDLKLKIGILADRGRGRRWDHDTYRLDLANEDDSQGSTRVPHGLVVNHAHVPDFSFDPRSLVFEFKPLLYGAGNDKARERDRFLQVKLPVVRQSGHYDKNIMPILTLLNVVAISCLPRNFDSATASTETMLSIAFVEVGIRLTVDSRLPSVGYPIKLQKVLNHCFWLLCSLVLESNVVFFLVTKRDWEISDTDWIDLVAGTIAMIYTIYILFLYYLGMPSRAAEDGPKIE